jgi:hypothetical protein
MLLAMHLSLNYAAVRSVQMTSLNRQRANIVFSTLLDSDPDLHLKNKHLTQQAPSTLKQKEETQSQTKWHLPTPAQVARQEKIFEANGILKWFSPIPPTKHELGFCRMGVSLQQFLAPSPSTLTGSGSFKTPIPMSRLSSLFKSEDYFLFFHRNHRTWEARILLKTSNTTLSQLKAWMHALLTARALCASANRMQQSEETEIEYIMNELTRTLAFLDDGSRFHRYMLALTQAGWDINVAALETKSGRRVACDG